MRQLLMVGSLFFDHHYLWKETNDVLNFCMQVFSSMKGGLYYNYFRLGEASCILHPIFSKETQLPLISKNYCF